MSNPSNPTEGGVDLSHLKEGPVDFEVERQKREAAEAEEQARQQRAAAAEQQLRMQAQDAEIQRVAASWDRAMQRAFKGIVRRDVRHRYLSKGLAA